MALESRDRLQVNAIIIAGLLILLTIQSTSQTFWDLNEDHELIEEKIHELDNLAKDNLENSDLQKKINERIMELEIKDAETLAEANLAERTIDPMYFFLVAIILLTVSCVWEICFVTKNIDKASSKWDTILPFIGLFMFIVATIALILIRIFT